MSPVGWKHSLCVENVADVMRQVFGSGFFVREEKPLPIEEHSDPQPDVAVYPGIRRTHVDHPRNALLVVEVANTTLKHDAGVKARLYAALGTTDYWVIDLERRRLMVFREPKPDASSESGFSYYSLTKHAEDATVSPLAKPDVRINVADMLP